MKKIITVIAIATLFTACVSKPKVEVPATDSIVAIDSTVEVVVAVTGSTGVTGK